MEGCIELCDRAEAFHPQDLRERKMSFPPERKLRMALQQMKEHNIGMAPSVHTGKRVIGRFMRGPSFHFGTILQRYWAHTLTVVLGLVVLVAVLIPFLSYAGLDVIAKPLFFALHTICAQIPSHSFFILGHQLGLCARNLAIYTSMFLGGLVFVLSNKRLPGIPWWVWVLMMLPMAWDGTTQLFGWRESTWELRLITGTLFGGGIALFVLPLIQKCLLETSPIHPQLPPLQPQAPLGGALSTNGGSGSFPLSAAERDVPSSGE